MARGERGARGRGLSIDAQHWCAWTCPSLGTRSAARRLGGRRAGARGAETVTATGRGDVLLAGSKTRRVGTIATLGAASRDASTTTSFNCRQARATMGWTTYAPSPTLR